MVTGVGGLEQAAACLEMLARFYNVPFRKDVVQRRPSKPWAAVLAAWSSSAISPPGWASSTLVEGDPGCIASPCFALLLDQPAMIHDISRVVKAVVPEYGCITVPLSELLQDQAACEFSPRSWTRQSAAKVELPGSFPRSVSTAAV